jgi:hypothetical protein
MPSSCQPVWIAALALIAWLAPAQIGGPPPPSTQIEVVVTDTNNAPIAEAEVNVSIAGPLAGSRRRASETSYKLATGLDGKCTVPIPTAAFWRVGVQRDGYLDAEEPTRVEHVETVRVEFNKTVRLTVGLLKASALEGTVYLDDGRRVSQARVQLQPAVIAAGPERRWGPAWLVERTDKNGHYRFPVVPPGDYGMWISPPEALVMASLKQGDNDEWTGYAGTLWHPSVTEVQNIVPVTLEPGDELRGIDPILRPVKVHPLKGVLYDQLSREPLTHAMVGLRVAGAAPVEVLAPRAVNEETGAFEFPPLPEEEYDLLVYRDGPGLTMPWPVRISLGGTQERNEHVFVPGPDPVEALWTRLGHTQEDGVGVLVPNWTAWSGRLWFHDSVKPDQGGALDSSSQALTEVRLLPLDLPEFAPVVASLDPRSPKVDAEGLRRGFDLQTTPLPPGSYEVQVVLPEGWFLDSITISNADLLKPEGVVVTPEMAGLEINLQPGGAALQGLVANTKAEPVGNAAVCLVSGKPWRLRQPGGAFCVHADEAGQFRSRWLSPGAWRVWAFPKRPLERPGSAAFEARYGLAARPIDVPPDAGLLRITLLCPE